MKRIRAVFTGQNKSLGYVTGMEYELVLIQPVQEASIRIHRQKDGSGQCEYSNTIAFLDNWTDIQVMLKES